ncbi:MAG: hypothetical protein Kow0037_31140 [Calditrichia bacterium]
MGRLFTILLILFILLPVYGQNIWINEFHYDNAGTDEGEFVEIVVPSTFTELASVTFTLYNGSGGVPYDSYTLDTFTKGASQNGFDFYYKEFPSNGIQNGPDGFALDYNGTVLQFISYEGSFAATDGPASGQTSVDIGVSETGSTPAGFSLFLVGSGTQYSDFTWSGPDAETKGDINSGQSFGSGTPLSVSNLTPQYTVPPSGSTMDVSCDITGGTPPYVPVIKYTVEGVPQADISMSPVAGDTYTGTIPAQADAAAVEYYVQVTDAGGRATATSSTNKVFWGVTPIGGKLRNTNADGSLVYEGYNVRVTGVATVGSGTFNTSALETFVQDATGGICIYESAGTNTMTLGNSYTVTGTLTNFRGKAEILLESQIDNGAGILPQPLVMTIAQLLVNPENYEGMLIGIQHLSKTDGIWPSAGSDANLTVTDDGGATTLTFRIDKDTDLDDNPEPAWPKDVVGIFTQYDGSAPYDGGYQIQPRGYSDILGDGSLPVSLTAFTARAGDGMVILNWSTASEVDNLGFEILRSEEKDGQYITIASYQSNDALKGQLNSNAPHDYRYMDELVGNGKTYYYKLVDVTVGGYKTYHGPVSAIPNSGGIDIKNNGIVPASFALHQNYPNPFNPETHIQIDIPALYEGTLQAELNIYNSLGQKVRTLYRDRIAPGSYTIDWNATDDFGKPVPTGMYFAVFTSDKFTQSIKLMLMK